MHRTAPEYAGGLSNQRRHPRHRRAALARIPLVPKDQRKSGLIGTVLSSVDGRPDFVAALLEKGLASDDEHSIKLVEACIREHRTRGAPELLSAAQAWLNRG